MRLLHVVPTYLPAVRYGGPVVSVHGLATALATLGHDVHVYTTSVDGPVDSDVPLETPVERDGLEITYFRCPAMRRLYWAPALKRWLRRTVADFDIVHLHSVFLWPTLVAARAAENVRVPYVLSPRGMLVPELVAGKSRLAKQAWIHCFERHTLSAASAVHLTSVIEREDLLRMGLEPQRAEVIPNGIDLPRRARDGDTTPPTRYLLFLGRISWKKGIDRLIRAMRSIPDAELRIAGGDDEGLAPQLKRLAESEGVDARVHFIGPVRGEEKDRVLAGADLLVLPSLSENFGNVVLEAMAHARPVVVTKEVGLAPVVERARCGVVVDGDPTRLATHITALLADPGKAGTNGQGGPSHSGARVHLDGSGALHGMSLPLHPLRGELRCR